MSQPIAHISTLPIVTDIELDKVPLGAKTQLRVQMVGDGLGQIIHAPVVVMRGTKPGPVLGVTAAIHGNELNGMLVIHQLLRDLNLETLCGTVVLVPVVNVPGYLRRQRYYEDGTDLNRIMPGKEGGSSAQVYAARFVARITHCFEYLLDLHTASTGRINSLYVRANLEHPVAAWMAMAQHPQIIIHNPGNDGTLRAALMQRGIPAITVEVGNPQQHQRQLVKMGLAGVLNVMKKLGMVSGNTDGSQVFYEPPVVCGRSFWMYTTAGGVLDVLPGLTDRVAAGQVVARVRDVYGNLVEEYRSPEAGVVIGRSVDPVNPTGSRILHLGVPADADGLKRFEGLNH